jgi:hypothetical protein
MGMDDEDMEMSMTSLLPEGETIPEDEATEKGRMWSSMSAIDAELARPSQFLPLRPSGKSKMNRPPNAPSSKVRAHNRPDDWLTPGKKNTKRSWRPKQVLEDNEPGEAASSDFGDESGHNSFQSSRGHNSMQSLPTTPGGQAKGNNIKIPIVIQQKEWASPMTTDKPKLSLNSSSIHSVLTDDSRSRISDAKDFFYSPKSTTKATVTLDLSMHSNASEDSKSLISGARDTFERQISLNNTNDIGSPVSSMKSPAKNNIQKWTRKTTPSTLSPQKPPYSLSPSPEKKGVENRRSAPSSIQLASTPDLNDDDNGVGLERGQDASSKPGLLDMAMEKMEASMASIAVEDELETTSAAKSVIEMWNSMSVINTKSSLDEDAQSRASRGSKVKWSFKDAEKKKNEPAPLNENESDESKSKPQERKRINEKTPQENSPELEASLTSLASNVSSESTDNVISKYSKSMSCIDYNQPDEFLPLRPKYRAKKATAIQHKCVAHNRPDDWLGPYAGSKTPKRSWTAKKVVEVGDMGDDDDSSDESDKEKEDVDVDVSTG